MAWSADAAGRMRRRRGLFAESVLPGAMVSQVARRHDVLPSQIYAWRKAAREGSLVLTGGPAFATVEVSGPLSPETKLEQACVVPTIEIEAGAMAVRISGSADTALVERIIRALRAGM